MSVTGKRGVGIPIILLYDAAGGIVTIELKNGCTYRGTLEESQDNMNCLMKNCTKVSPEGEETRIDQAYIRGSQISFVIVPDALSQAPFFNRIKMWRKYRGHAVYGANTDAIEALSGGFGGRGGGRGGGGRFSSGGRGGGLIDPRGGGRGGGFSSSRDGGGGFPPPSGGGGSMGMIPPPQYGGYGMPPPYGAPPPRGYFGAAPGAAGGSSMGSGAPPRGPLPSSYGGGPPPGAYGTGPPPGYYGGRR